MPIAKLAPEYTSDDIASDLQHLCDLVETVVDSLVEIDRSNLDCTGKNELNRATSLAWITRDQLELIQGRVSPKNDADGAERVRTVAQVKGPMNAPGCHWEFWGGAIGISTSLVVFEAGRAECKVGAANDLPDCERAALAKYMINLWMRFRDENHVPKH
jgi:hypothetical protein